jgi:D-glycero-D-manno-heptose 1,7-bisphosphate phosphatase
VGGARADVVLLDRDGVINDDGGAFVTSIDEWRPLPGSLEAIAALHRGGFRVVVITNQSGVGRGLFTEPSLQAIHDHMVASIERVGGAVAGVYYCPHAPEAGCDCRKPKPGLLRRIERELDCSLAGVPFIGDRLSDVEAADLVGARPMLVRTGTGAATEKLLTGRSIEIFDDLASAARALLAERG